MSASVSESPRLGAIAKGDLTRIMRSSTAADADAPGILRTLGGGARAPLVLLLLGPALMLFAAGPAGAQELEPRAYRALPTGLDFINFSYSFSSGNVVVDPSLPIEDLQADIHTATLAYLRTFGFAGRSASVSILAPYVYASASVLNNGQFTERTRRC